MKNYALIMVFFIGIFSATFVNAEEKVEMWNSFIETSLTQSNCLQLSEKVLKSAKFSGVYKSASYSYHGFMGAYTGSIVCSHKGTVFFAVVGPNPSELSRLRSKMMDDFNKEMNKLKK